MKTKKCRRPTGAEEKKAHKFQLMVERLFLSLDDECSEATEAKRKEEEGGEFGELEDRNEEWFEKARDTLGLFYETWGPPGEVACYFALWYERNKEEFDAEHAEYLAHVSRR